LNERSPIRIALLGLAHVHGPLWAEAFTADPRARLERIWDDDVLRGVAGATRFRTLFMSDLASAIDAADAVAITSETVDHERLIAAAATAGKPILCEKPVAIDLAQARRIAASLQAATVPFMQSFPKRLDPVNHALRDVIRSGELGRITLARVRHGHAHGSDPAFTSGWWTDPARSGGGTLLDEGVHAADLLRWLFGPPATVTATLAHHGGFAVEDAALATFQWPDGMIGEIAAGWTMLAGDVSIEIYGTSGTALVSGVDLASKGRQAAPGLWVCAEGQECFEQRSEPPLFSRGGFHQAVARSFVSMLAGEGPSIASLSDGLGAQAMIEGAYRAARSGTRQIVEPIQEQEVPPCSAVARSSSAT
jgi:predicted dehydrogenase